MNGFDFFLKGLIIGFSIAAPVGPIGVLCIRRTLAEGRTPGFLSGLGGCHGRCPLRVCCRVWIDVYLRLPDPSTGRVPTGGRGLSLLSRDSRPSWQDLQGNQPRQPETGLLGAYISTFFLTLTNPMTILAFAAIFAGLGIARQGENYGSAGVLVLGVFLGSALWWFILSSGVDLFRKRFNLQALRWVNRALRHHPFRVWSDFPYRSDFLGAGIIIAGGRTKLHTCTKLANSFKKRFLKNHQETFCSHCQIL